MGKLHLPAIALHDFGPHHRIHGVIGALHKHFRLKQPNQFQRRFLIENRDAIHRRQGSQHSRARGFILDGPRRAFQALHTVITVQANHQPVTPGPRLFQQMHMAGVQKIKAAIGEAHAPAAPAPAFHLLKRSRTRHHLTQRTAFGPERFQNFLFPRHSRANLTHRNAGGDIRQAHGHRQGQFRAKPGSDRGHHRIPRARDILHFGGFRREMMQLVAFQKRHAVFAACHQHGAKAMRIAQRPQGSDDIFFRVHRHAGGFRQLRTVRRHQISPGIAAIIAPLRVHHHAPARCPRRLDKPRGRIAHQHALAVIGQHHHRGGCGGIAGNPHQPIRKPLLDWPHFLMIRAQHVLTIGQKARFRRGGAPALHQQPGLNPRLPADQPGQVTAGLVIANHGNKGHGGTKRGQVAHHIAGTARHGDFAFHGQYRHWRFRADALRPAINIAVQHGITHNQRRSVAELPRCSHQFSDRDFSQWPIHEGRLSYSFA